MAWATPKDDDAVMGWDRLRPWWTLAGLIGAVALLTAIPGVVNAVHLPGPHWAAPVGLAAASALLATAKPLLTVRNEALASRARETNDRDARAGRAVQNLPTRGGKVPRVDQVDPTLLDIHPSIPLPTDTLIVGLSPDLPQYVTRDIDADLRTFLQARSATGGFALLLGPAAAGKTRTAYEALRQVLPDWKLVLPSNGEEVNAWAEGRNRGRSVVWLNETQDFLTGSDPLRAATVRRLLADTARPVILIGTIWSDRYDQLRTSSRPVSTSLGSSRAEGNGPGSSSTMREEPAGEIPVDPVDSRQLSEESLNGNARDVLSQARRFSMPGFTVPEWERAHELASRDPRLSQATAHRNSGLGLTQILSAAPELILRWEQADNPYGKAILTAAVMARRCGHPQTLPAPVLNALAIHFLTGNQLASASASWFTEALAWSCQPVHHTNGISPLRPHGQTPGHIDGYRITDVLANHTGPTSPAPAPIDVSDTFWETLTAGAAPSACVAIGRAAYIAERRTQAEAAWGRAADAGFSLAMHNRGLLAFLDGDRGTAYPLLSRAADDGNTDAMTLLGTIAFQDGDRNTARTWWTRAAEADNAYALALLASLTYADGDRETARTLLTRTGDLNIALVNYLKGQVAYQDGDREAARAWFTRATDSDDANANAMNMLGIIAFQDGDRATARTWWTRASSTDDTNTTTMTLLGIIASEDGDHETARAFLTRAADSDEPIAIFSLGSIARSEGDLDTARTFLSRAADADDSNAMALLGSIAYENGDRDSARTWWTRAANADNTSAAAMLGIVMYEDGDRDTARSLLTRAADSGEAIAMSMLGTMAREDGDHDSARGWWTRAADNGDTNAMFFRGLLAHEEGDSEAARTWWTRAADNGNALARAKLGE